MSARAPSASRQSASTRTVPGQPVPGISTPRNSALRQSASAPGDAVEHAKQEIKPARLALSFEVIPPRAGNTQDVDKLDNLLTNLAAYQPDYIAVTSSKRSGWLEGTTALIRHITDTTRMRPLAHVACTTGPAADLTAGIEELIDAGVRGLLALRGDLPLGATRLPDDHLQHATDMIKMIRDVEKQQAARFAAGRLAVGVACYPSGHAESANFDEDIDVLLAKQRLGADFAITQLFFDAQEYLDFVQHARLAGVTIPLIPGIMPMTSVKRLIRMGELAGVSVPDDLMNAMRRAAEISPEAEYATGLDLTVELTSKIIAGGAGGLHIYTHNNIDVTRALLERVGVEA